MKRPQIILLAFVLLLVACTSPTAKPAAPEAPLPSNDVTAPEPAVNEQAAQPQFIMFTASW